MKNDFDELRGKPSQHSALGVVELSELSEKAILIVDDDELVCETLGDVLHELGYETETAVTGREAIEKAKERFFDAALIDIRLPDMEGTDLLSALKEMHPETTAIIITGYASLENVTESLDKGADAYVMKPIDVDEIRRMVEWRISMKSREK